MLALQPRLCISCARTAQPQEASIPTGSCWFKAASIPPAGGGRSHSAALGLHKSSRLGGGWGARSQVGLCLLQGLGSSSKHRAH